MTKSKKYDLEERTEQFASDVRSLLRGLKHDFITIEDSKQLIRASGSVGANYIEANEALSKKDFKFRMKICRKEAKESRYWLRLIKTTSDHDPDKNRKELIQEATELLKIFSSIISKSD